VKYLQIHFADFGCCLPHTHVRHDQTESEARVEEQTKRCSKLEELLLESRCSQITAEEQVMIINKKLKEREQDVERAESMLKMMRERELEKERERERERTRQKDAHERERLELDKIISCLRQELADSQRTRGYRERGRAEERARDRKHLLEECELADRYNKIHSQDCLLMDNGRQFEGTVNKTIIRRKYHLCSNMLDEYCD
jgi:hypothetical protein